MKVAAQIEPGPSGWASRTTAVSPVAGSVTRQVASPAGSTVPAGYVHAAATAPADSRQGWWPRSTDRCSARTASMPPSGHA